MSLATPALVAAHLAVFVAAYVAERDAGTVPRIAQSRATIHALRTAPWIDPSAPARRTKAACAEEQRRSCA